MTINDELADKAIARTIDLMRYDAHLRRKVLRLQTQMVARLEAEILLEPNPDRLYKINAIIDEGRSIIDETYGEMEEYTSQELRKLAIQENEAVTRNFSSVLKVDLERRALTTRQLDTIMSQSWIDGANVATWFDRQSKYTQRKFADNIRMGMLQGLGSRDIAKLFKNLVGTRSRRDIEALTRTAVQAIGNEARMKTWEQHDDLVKGYQTLVTLDTRTSKICISRSGFAWNKDGTPMNSTTTIPFPGRPPWHFNCRTVLTAVLKSWAELSGKKNIPDFPKGTRASLDGQVAEDITYEQWLKKQPVNSQIDVLGKGRYDLWKEGKLDFRYLVDQTGNPLTLDELQDRVLQ